MLWHTRQQLTMLLAMALLVLAPGVSLLANPVQMPYVQADLGSTVATIQPGGVLLGRATPAYAGRLAYLLEKSWGCWSAHGDSLGAASRLYGWGHWWPYPQRLPVGPLMNYGYEGEVSLLTQITAPADLPPEQFVTLQAHTTWVVCAELCVPGAATLELHLPVSTESPQPDARRTAVLAQAQSTLPKPASWQVVFSGDQDTFTLLLESPYFATTGITEATFFPLEYGIIDHAALQQTEITPQGLHLTIRRGTLDATNLTRIDGVLVLQKKRDSLACQSLHD